MHVIDRESVVESSQKGSIMDFTGALVTIVTVRKRDSGLILIVVAAGFSSFLKKFYGYLGTWCLNLSTHNGYVQPTIEANHFGIPLTS